MLDAYPELELDTDIDIAARTSVPVLISGTRDDTMRIAMTIAGSGEHGPRRSVLVTEATGVRRIAATLNGDTARRVVLLRNIDLLDHDQQAWLIEAILTRCRTAGTPDWRLIATTSVALFDQVAAGSFAAPLFYLLNAIHIIV
jgi:hypothetical protein